MQTLHLVGHRPNWNLDAYYKNQIGDGFVFCAYSFPFGFLEKKTINGYNTEDILNKSFLDLQFFGKKESGNINKGKLNTYPFHPAADPNTNEKTSAYMEAAIRNGVQYQIDLGLRNIIIPTYYENENLNEFTGHLETINKWLRKNKKANLNYYMTIPITHHTVIDDEKIEKLLYCLTDMDIAFDGYYIVCESKPDSMQKISVDFKYFKNLSRVFQVLKKQKFKTIYAYANWDAIMFLATTEIDFITIATFENLRNFSIKRFLMTEDGGPSKGWYYSEKLLNMIKAQFIELVRSQHGIDIIKNDRNIFSDDLLAPNFPWSNQKPEVYKNYILSIDRTLKKIGSISDLTERKAYVLKMLEDAISAYDALEKKKIFLNFESKNYHLDLWRSYLLTR